MFFRDICKQWWFLSICLAFLLLFMFKNDVEREEVLLEAPKGWPIYLPPSYGSQLRSYNYSRLRSKEKQFVESYMPVMLSRVAAVGDYCSRHPEILGHNKDILLGWIGRPIYKPNLVWCPNFKVGFGTWLTNFLREGHFNEYNPQILALPPTQRDKARFKLKFGAHFTKLAEVFNVPSNDQEKSEFFVDAIRFLVVRHPFTRILSAYRNKFDHITEGAMDEEEYSLVRQEILQNYRPNYVYDKNAFPTFSEFVDYLLDVTRKYKTLEEWSQAKDYWHTFWSHCDVCSSDFTIVAKLETMKQDERFVAILADLEEIKNRKKVEWQHKIQNKSSFEEAENYYRLLTMKQMTDLYNVYKHDFEMFRYSIDEYIPLAVDYKKIK